MLKLETNVVAFDNFQAKKEIRPDSAIVAECRGLFAQHSKALLQAFFSKTDDELFALSNKAENSTLQNLYFEAMRYVRREKEGFERQFLEQTLREYDLFWQNKSLRVIAKPASKAALDESSFSLVDNESLEEELAIKTMIDKANNLFQPSLYGLQKRFAALLDKEDIEQESLPLSPSALCQAFASVLKPLTIDLKIKLIIYKLFDRLAVASFGPMYVEINSTLANHGILPTLPRGVKQLGQRGPADRSIGAHANDEFQDNAAYLEAFHAMQNLLDSWRARSGVPTLNPGGLLPACEVGDVMNALNVLQHPTTVLADANGALNEGLKNYILTQLQKLTPGDSQRALGRLEEDIIDMVALIFDYILGDRNLPDPVKGLIARLQIPIVKVAILEKSFFAKKNHPARALLNGLAQAGVGLDLTEGNDNPVFRKIEEVVGRVINEFDQHVALFAELLDDFNAFNDKDNQRSRIAEERTKQVTQSKEHLLLAKKKSAYEVAARLQGKAVPSLVRTFLTNAWKDVLVLAYLRKDKEEAAWSHYVHAIDQLIFTVTPPASSGSRKELLQAIPPLLQTLRQGLEAISYDPQQLAKLFKDLEVCHVACLNPHNPPLERHVVEQMDEIANSLIDPDKADELDGGDVEEIVLGGAPKDQPAEANPNLVKARQCQVGDWFELQDEHGKSFRAKLAWKSTVTSMYVFVNRKGVKVAEMTSVQLAAQFRAGTAVLIEGSSVPLMDRALSALMQTMRHNGKNGD